MTLLLRRAPREIYRVYSEEEYLGGAGSELPITAEWPVDKAPRAAEPAHHGLAEHRLRRAAGVAMLAGAVGAVGGLVCLNLARAHGDGAEGRGSLVATTRPARSAGSAPAAEDVRPEAESSRPVVVRPVDTNGARSARPRRSGGPTPRRSDHLSNHPLARRPAGVAVLADYVHRSPASGEAPAAPISAPAPAPVTASAPASSSAQPAPDEESTTTSAVAGAQERPAPERQAEFGFER